MSSSFQQNWIHSIRTSFAKVMAVLVLLFGSGPESLVSRSLRSTGPGICGLKFFPALCQGVVWLWIGVRRNTGVCPESPARPESPASLDRNLRSAPMTQRVGCLWCPVRKEPGARPEFPVHLHRSLRSGQAPTASFCEDL